MEGALTPKLSGAKSRGDLCARGTRGRCFGHSSCCISVSGSVEGIQTLGDVLSFHPVLLGTHTGSGCSLSIGHMMQRLVRVFASAVFTAVKTLRPCALDEQGGGFSHSFLTLFKLGLI